MQVCNSSDDHRRWIYAVYWTDCENPQYIGLSQINVWCLNTAGLRPPDAPANRTSLSELLTDINVENKADFPIKRLIPFHSSLNVP